MNEMLGLVGFDALSIRCIIGDLPSERESEQEIIIDLRCEVDLNRVAVTDDLNHTIDYIKLSSLCIEEAKTGKYRLIEKFAAVVIVRLISEFKIKSAWIRVRKPAAIPNSAGSIVELKRTNPYYDR